MTATRYFCGTEGRRAEVRGSAFNGIDYVEIIGEDQLHVAVHFVNDDATVGALAVPNFAIDGGVRVKGVKVVSLAHNLDVVTLEVDRAGDYSPYTLRLQKSETDPEPPPNIDPQLSSIVFSFKVECPSDFDCAEGCDCPLHTDPKTQIDYLAKDYESFRRVMLDRLALVLPDWTERNPADAGVAMVEMLAYVADMLSYEQDAVANEAYLATARKRTSVRRHARLLDYEVDDGSNARVWVCLTVRGTPPPLPMGTPLITHIDRVPEGAILPADFHADVVESSGALIFETLEAATGLREDHNELQFYTWSSKACCLPAGSTRATLSGSWPSLSAGRVLVFREKRGPESGIETDADPKHAHAVRLTKASPGTDPVNSKPITEIEWGDEDRLPFPLCVSAELQIGSVPDVSVAHANVVLADHGRTVLAPGKTYSEILPTVPEPSAALDRAVRGSAACGNIEHVQAPLRYRPRLSHGPVTRSALRRFGNAPKPQPFDPSASAESAMKWERRYVVPHLVLTDDKGVDWHPQRDLLGSDPLALELVVESEDDGTAALRFGDDRHGRRPDAGTLFTALYRVGNGSRGNVGARAIRHIVTSNPGIAGATNYTAARGGTDAESTADVRLKAPVAFRRQERAVTAADYEEVATRHPDVQRAAATFRWTGSWNTVYLTVDRRGGQPVDDDFRETMRRHLDRYRMAGYDVDIDVPHFVPLEIALFVCVLPDYFRADVERALLDVLSSRVRPDGTLGFFHPDRFTFGQSVYLSKIVAAAHSVTGVQSVEVSTFQRRGTNDAGVVAVGELPMDRLEIARLDNDPNFPEHGVLQLRMGGGR